MKIIHRIAFNTLDSNELFSAIKDIGIKYKTAPLPGKESMVVSIEISEDNPEWVQVHKLLKSYIGFELYQSKDSYETFFSEDEIRNAEWVRVIPTFSQGYPEPKSNWPFKQLSLNNVCPVCGIYEQCNLMRMNKEPSIRQNSFMALIGLGEIFCVPDVFKSLNSTEADDFEVWDVLIHRTNQISEKVKQLYVPGVSEPGLLDTEKMRKVICKKCGTAKYLPHWKGEMLYKKDALNPNTNFIKTHEWFGVGIIAFRELLVSNRIANLIIDKGWKGVRLKIVSLI